MNFLKCRKQGKFQKVTGSESVSIFGNIIAVKVSEESFETLIEQLDCIGVKVGEIKAVDTMQEALDLAAKAGEFSTIMRSTCVFKTNYAIWASSLKERVKSAPHEIVAHGIILEKGLTGLRTGAIPKIKMTGSIKVLDVPAFSLTPTMAGMLSLQHDKDLIDRVDNVDGVYFVLHGDQYAIDESHLNSGNMQASRIKINDFPCAGGKKKNELSPGGRELVAVVFVNSSNAVGLKKTVKCLEEYDLKTVIVTDNVKIDLCEYSTSGKFLVKIHTIENRKAMGECYSLFAASMNIPEDSLIIFIESGEVFERASIEFILGQLTANDQVIFGPMRREIKSMIIPSRLARLIVASTFDKIKKTWNDKLEWKNLKQLFLRNGAKFIQTTVTCLH